jgi:hypothetical protein
MVQQKITSFQTAKGGSRVDNQDPILKELTTLGTMVLEINTKMNDFVLPGHKSNNYGSTFFVGIRSKSVSNVYITFFGIHVQFVI